MTTKIRSIVFGQVSIEFLLLNLCLFIILPQLTATSATIGLGEFIQLLIVSNLSWAIIILLNGEADFYISNDFSKRLKYLLLNSFIFVGITYTIGILFHIRAESIAVLLGPIFLFFVLNLVIFKLTISWYKRRNRTEYASNILVVGAEDKWNEELNLTKYRRRPRYNVVGFIEPKASKNTDSPRNVLGDIGDLSQVLEEHAVDEVFISLSSVKEKKVRKAIEAADYHGVRVNLKYDAPDFLNNSSVDDLSIFQVRVTPLDRLRNMLLKKGFDFIFSLSVIILLSPVFLLIALLISIEVKGSFLYCPMRKGEQGKTFKCYKFRTMKDCDDPSNGTKSTVKNDPRITRIGKFLRKYDLDELPQFINVLQGHMSVVGPRPHRVFLQNDFRKIVNDYMVRHYVKPGITGWAQVNGWRGPTQSTEQKKERVKHDLWYIENWSLWLDIKIVFLTVFGKKTRKNAF